MEQYLPIDKFVKTYYSHNFAFCKIFVLYGRLMFMSLLSFTLQPLIRRFNAIMSVHLSD